MRDVVAELAGAGCALLVATHDRLLLPHADAVLPIARGRLELP